MATCGTGGWAGPLPGDPGDVYGLTATPTFGGIHVAWNLPGLNPFAVAYTTVFRGLSANYGTALKIGDEGGNRYFDVTPTGQPEREYFYWVQQVSVNGTLGVLVGPASATARPTITQMLELLTAQIDESHLAEALRAPIANISTLDDDLAQEVLDRLAAEAALQAVVEGVDDRADQLTTLVIDERTIRQEQNAVLVTAMNAIAASAGGDSAAAVIAEQEVRVSEDGALAKAVLELVALNGGTGGAASMLLLQQTVQAYKDSILGGQTVTVQGVLGNNIASVQTNLQTNINTVDGKATAIGARWTAQVDVNGLIGGFGVYNSGARVDAGFDVDMFWVGRTTNKIKPFIITGEEVFINRAVVGMLDVNNINARGLSIYNTAGDLVLDAGATLNSQVSPAGIGLRTFRVVSMGYESTTQPVYAGLYNAETQALLSSPGVMYNVVRISRSTGVATVVGAYNTLGNPAAGTAMANALAALGSDQIVVVYSFDEPQSAGVRLQTDLATQMYRCGASRAVYGSPDFAARSAYVLIGIPGCGEGNGAEGYQSGTVNAWVDMAFTIMNGNIVGVSNGYTPKSLSDYGYTGSLNANYTTNTNQLTDGAGLGQTAIWTQVAGTGKPADYASVGSGGNMLLNPTFLDGSLAGWSYGENQVTGSLLAVDNWSGLYKLNGRETAYIHVPGTYAADTGFAEVNPGTYQVVPGRYYQFSILVDLHRSGVQLYSVNRNFSGGILGYGGYAGDRYSGLPANGGVSMTWKVDDDSMGPGNVEANYRRLFFTVQAPAGCATIVPVVRMFQPPGTTAAYCFMARAQFCEVAGPSAVAAPYDMGSGYAQYSAEAARASADAANAGLTTRLSKTSSDVLSGVITMNTVGAPAGFRTGNLSWDAGGGYLSGSGAAMTNRGFVAVNTSGEVTFDVNGGTGDVWVRANGTFGGVLTAQAINAIDTINLSGEAVSIVRSSFVPGNLAEVSFNVPTHKQGARAVIIASQSCTEGARQQYVEVFGPSGFYSLLRNESASAGTIPALNASVTLGAVGNYTFRLSTTSGTAFNSFIAVIYAIK